MKTIQLKISVKALDCYIYGGYIFFVMQDGRIVYGSYEKLINRAIKKIGGETELLKVAFRRNENYYSKQIKPFLKIPGVKDAIYRNWNQLMNEDLRLEWEDFEDLMTTVCEYESFPIDFRIYGMRMFIGCRKGLYEVKLRPVGRKLNPAKIEKCFDSSKIISVNPKFGELVASADSDGLIAKSIDMDGDSTTFIHDRDVIMQRSLRTGWSDYDIFNYSDTADFSFYANECETVKNENVKYWEKAESKRISNFGIRQHSMDSMLEMSRINKEDILYCFNGTTNAFLHLKNGKLVTVTLKGNRQGEIGEFTLSQYVKQATKDSTIKDFGRIVSGFTIPKGCVIEYFDKVILLRDSHAQVIEDGIAIKVRNFMSSNKYQDVLSITKDNEVILHAIDTLDLDRNLNEGYIRNSSVEPIDLFAGMDAIPYKFIGKIEGSEVDNENDLPW
ncbi:MULTISPECIES: hypothetical protein [unclassified Bacteroides]|uniref:hypothetical protein n=1 Tax=unclassified Bacteroides TaxID=2646097 RepID=UPI0004E19611|nr:MULTISPECIES: hypothetical protein [unclassified Bacteroides]